MATTAWKLVEAEPEHPDKKDSNNMGNKKNGATAGRGGGRANNSRRQGGRFGARNGYYNRGFQPYIDPQMREYYTHMAIQQIELMFSIDHLCVNTYFRSFMDEEGYIPIAFVANYEHIACYGAPLDELMIKLSQKEDAILDVDMENETIRLKEGWETWLIPNPTGGRGCPRYIKQNFSNGNGQRKQYQSKGKSNNGANNNSGDVNANGTGNNKRGNRKHDGAMSETDSGASNGETTVCGESTDNCDDLHSHSEGSIRGEDFPPMSSLSSIGNEKNAVHMGGDSSANGMGAIGTIGVPLGAATATVSHGQSTTSSSPVAVKGGVMSFKDAAKAGMAKEDQAKASPPPAPTPAQEAAANKAAATASASASAASQAAKTGKKTGGKSQGSSADKASKEAEPAAASAGTEPVTAAAAPAPVAPKAEPEPAAAPAVSNGKPSWASIAAASKAAASTSAER